MYRVGLFPMTIVGKLVGLSMFLWANNLINPINPYASIDLSHKQ